MAGRFQRGVQIRAPPQGQPARDTDQRGTRRRQLDADGERGWSECECVAEGERGFIGQRGGDGAWFGYGASICIFEISFR